MRHRIKSWLLVWKKIYCAIKEALHKVWFCAKICPSDCVALAVFLFVLIGFAIVGCSRSKPIEARGVPKGVVRYEVPLSNTAAKPALVCLRPGQTAMLLENIEVEARIPYQGGELWTGRVVIEKGSMVVKPLVEGD